MHTSGHRLVQLDLLRGIAVLLVIGNHFVLQPGEAGVLRPVAELFRSFGWVGVDLFFVLSGFLVGGLLFKELREREHLDIRRFILRRGFKIWPAYYVFLAAVLGLALYRNGGALQSSLAEVAPNVFHVQNYFPGGGGHTWSLAVEEHFYLTLPLLLLVLLRVSAPGGKALRPLPWIVAAVGALCLGARCLNLGRPYSDTTHFYATHLRCDSLFLGYWYHFDPDHLVRAARRPGLLLMAGAALVLPAGLLGWAHPFTWTAGFLLLAVGCGCFLIALVYAEPGKGSLSRVVHSGISRLIARVGYFSYSIYLWHDLARLPVKQLRERVPLDALPTEWRWLVVNLLFLFIGTAMGVVMAKLVELPALAIRDRLFPSRSSAGLAGPG